MSQHEFRIHHHVSEITSLLRAESTEGPGAEVYTDMLQKNMTPYITTQVSAHNAKRKIAESTSMPVEFLNKYEELKSKNVRDLDPLVYLLSKLCDDDETKLYLRRNAEERALAAGVSLVSPRSLVAQLPAPGSKITKDELEDIKARLMKETTRGIVGQSEASRRVLMERQLRNVNFPVQPDWIFHRTYLTADFVNVPEAHPTNVVPLGSLPVQIQEIAVIEDLLCCMEGIEGKYIRTQPLVDSYAPRHFQVDQTLEVTLRELVKRILPLCSNYSIIVRFIEEKSAFEYGLVNQALSSAMRTLIKDYLVLVAQLEHQFRQGQLSLQKFWFYIQPTARTMEILTSVANSINRGACIGGAVLSLLHEKTSSFIGDAEGQQLCLYLTQAACVPYFEILEKWIYKGIIQDPYSEFLIEENESFQKEKLQEDYNDAYWELHYTICREQIPVFLEWMADKVLNTGKYLNVVRECGCDVKCPCAEEIVYSIKERQYYDQIEKAYNFASRLLLDLLMQEKELRARFRSIKHYFLLDQGDFVVQFMDMAEDELRKTMDHISPTRLDTLLELALRTSTANVDPFKDDLRVELLSYDLVTQLFKILSIETKQEKEFRVDPTDLHLSGLEAFSFDYIVKWPLSLVLNRKALTRYQMLFRHLFYSKHVERQLCNVWLSNKSAKRYTLHKCRWYAAAFALRQRMLNFVQNFLYYMMFEVIEPNWHLLEANLDSVSNIDDVLAYHTDFLNVCLNDCMLTNPELLKTVHKLMMVCVTFSNFMQRLVKTTELELDIPHPTQMSTLQAAPTPRDRKADSGKKKATSKVVLEHVDQMAGSENFERTIAKFESNFSQLLVDLLDSIMESVSDCENKRMTILHRLDFNGFYTEMLETASAERSMMEASAQQQPPGGHALH